MLKDKTIYYGESMTDSAKHFEEFAKEFIDCT